MAVDPIKIQTVLRKASDQQLMALLKRPDSIPSMFVQQEIRRRNQARQAAKADMSKMAMAQRPQLTPEMSRMDQPPMPRPQDPMASAIPMREGGSGRLAEEKRNLMRLYNQGKIDIVQSVARSDNGELGNFAQALLSRPKFTDYDMTNPRNNFPGSRLNYSIAPMIQNRGTESQTDNNKSPFLNQLENMGIMSLENEFIEGQFDPEGKFDYGVAKEGYKPTMPNAAGREDIYLDTPLNTFPFGRTGRGEGVSASIDVDPRMRTNTIGFDPRTNIGEMRFPPNYASRENLVEPETNIDAVRPNILPSTVLDRRAIPRGPDFADQKFQQAKPSGMLETDAQLNMPIRSSTLSNIIDAFNNPVPDSGRFLATNKGDLDQARNLIQGEVGFGDISSTSGLEVPDDSGTLDIIGGIKNLGKSIDKIVQDSKSQIPSELMLPDNPSQTAIEQSLKDNFNYIKENLPELPKGNVSLASSDLIDKGILPEGLLAPTDDKATTTSDQIGQFDFVKKKEEKDTIKKADKNTTETVVDYTKPFTDKANMDNAFMDKDGKPLSAGDALKKQYQNLKESEAVNNDGKKTGGVGGAIASQYGALTDAQNKLIEAMKPNGGDRFWQLVAEFGANLAASDSPNFMQAAGQAMQQTLAEAKDMKKEDRQMLIDQAKVAVDLEFKRAELGLQLARINASAAKGGTNSLGFLRLQEQIAENIRKQNRFDTTQGKSEKKFINDYVAEVMKGFDYEDADPETKRKMIEDAKKEGAFAFSVLEGGGSDTSTSNTGSLKNLPQNLQPGQGK